METLVLLDPPSEASAQDAAEPKHAATGGIISVKRLFPGCTTMELQEHPAVDFSFPPLPSTLGEILEIVSQESENVDMDRLVQIMERDPAMTAYVLRQANSSYYAVRQYITRVDKAVTFLGFATVSRIALSAALKQAFTYLEAPATRHIFEYVMQTSLAAALLTKELSSLLRLSVMHTSFTAAMLHQLGRLVLLHSAEEQYTPLWGEQPIGARLVAVPPSQEAEQAALGSDYVPIGKATAEAWGFPEELVAVIAHHRDAAAVTKPHLKLFTQIVSAGHYLSNGLLHTDGAEAFRAWMLASPDLACLAELARTRAADYDLLIEQLTALAPGIREFSLSALN